MVPDLDLQLQVALKSLGDIVAPAVDPLDKVATEQLHLVIATLDMVRVRLPMQRRFVRRLLEDAIALAESLDAGSSPSGLGASIADARAALLDPELEAHEIEHVRSVLTSKIVSLIALAGPDASFRFGRAVLDGSGASLERLRAWCLPAGFEPKYGSIRPISALI